MTGGSTADASTGAGAVGCPPRAIRTAGLARPVPEELV